MFYQEAHSYPARVEARDCLLHIISDRGVHVRPPPLDAAGAETAPAAVFNGEAVMEILKPYGESPARSAARYGGVQCSAVGVGV